MCGRSPPCSGDPASPIFCWRKPRHAPGPLASLPISALAVLALLSAAALVFPAAAHAQTLTLLDQDGEPTASYIEGSTVTVHLDDPGANLNSTIKESATVDLSTLLAGDLETVTVTETGPDTGLFEGTIRLHPGAPLDGMLETTTDPGPPFVRDTVDADYQAGTATASANLVGSVTQIVDDYGQQTDEVPVLDRLRLKVIDPEADFPNALDTVQVTVIGTGDAEILYLLETGPDTFEGSVQIGLSTFPDDGILQAGFGEILTASHLHLYTPDASSVQATMAGSRTTLLDADGQPTAAYLDKSRVFLAIVDHNANSNPGAADTASVQVTTAIALDSELVSLTETGANTGVFEGTIDLEPSFALPDNGTLETDHDFGPPFVAETLDATYTDTWGQSAASASTLGSRTTFVDAYDNPVDAYALGSTVYIRLEDRVSGTYAPVTITANSDSEFFYLFETVEGGGILEGSLPLVSGGGMINHCRRQPDALRRRKRPARRGLSPGRRGLRAGGRPPPQLRPGSRRHRLGPAPV